MGRCPWLAAWITRPGIAGGKTTGLSLGGAKALAGSGIKRWSTGELSIVDRPCLPSARFVLRR